MPAHLLRCFRTCRHAVRSLSSTVALLNDGSSRGKFENVKSKGKEYSSHLEPKASWSTAWYFAAAGLIALSSTSSFGQTALVCLQEGNKEDIGVPTCNKKPKVVFVLGGPGSGKGTQCAKIVDTYGFTHLSAGDLLRAEINSGSKYGTMIENTIKEGKIVPAEVTVKLLQRAMKESDNDKFLIDGFPRNEENRTSFEAVTGIVPELVIFLDCTEEEMEKRLLNRNQGRVDDNMETIRKRFKVYLESTLPVVKQYEDRGKLRKINATKPVEEVFKSLQPLFVPFIKEDLLQSTKILLHSIDVGDYETYKRLCDPALTAFEPESQGHLVEGFEFQKFTFDQKRVELPFLTSAHSEMSSPKISLLGDKVGLITYTRLHQKAGREGNTVVKAYNETRVWEWKKDSNGKLVWKQAHCHGSKVPEHHLPLGCTKIPVLEHP